jgi:hypothetical protein
MAAMIRMIATTMSNSINEKPFWGRLMGFSPADLATSEGPAILHKISGLFTANLLPTSTFQKLVNCSFSSTCDAEIRIAGL